MEHSGALCSSARAHIEISKRRACITLVVGFSVLSRPTIGSATLRVLRVLHRGICGRKRPFFAPSIGRVLIIIGEGAIRRKNRARILRISRCVFEIAS